MHQKQDEIDLRIVFSSIRDSISKLFANIKKIAIFIADRKIYFAICGTIGIIIGVASYKLRKPIYSSSLTMNSYILSNRYCADLITTLDQLALEKNYEVLADRLNISVNQASKISRIEYRNFDLKFSDIGTFALEDDSIEVDVPFKVLVEVLDNSVLDTLETGLVNVFENNSYAKKRKILKKKYLTEMSDKYGLQIGELDTLKRTIEGALVQKNASQGIVFMQQSIDPLNTYREVIALYQQQSALDEQVDLVSSVEIIEGFTHFKKPSKPRLFFEIGLFGSVFFFLGLLLALLRKKKKTVTSTPIDQFHAAV